MSLILEALKKSEAKRRLGGVPDLNTPFAARRRRRSPLPFIAAAIVVAAAAGWWLWRVPPQTMEKTVPVVAGRPRSAGATPAADRIMASTDSHPPLRNAVAPATGVVATEHPATPPVVALPSPTASTKIAATPTAGTDKSVAAAPVSAVASEKPAPPVPRVALKPLVVGPPMAGLKPDAAPAPVFGPKKPQPAVAMAPLKAAEPAPMPRNAANMNNAANAKNAAASAPPVATSPAVQPYYELPFSVRKDLPAIKLSIHVYAPEPAQRFIILNDSRMGEGDSQDELALREIRPDGAVFEFHGQRFFYPRDGL